ncbi:hypothetical protein CONLIGDRAFT_680869 [Coniochaeta ligniaria NRRL 30616]|uniref:Zn(2)-C6 fungal-type domain-containing protein n=1 Tax=Coniochaeta ligniaria NRRL 30616 TaxID=1408157 RepID=A0A1J7JQQ1_9PEZI|nr:hypothetical protein CONLIGDRAFT_680869 [Coniochaeta ligniaria NRRL 30616]
MDGPGPSRSRLPTTKTCLECMRRKIRCNGELPCDRCVYYQVSTCQYRPRKQRKQTAPTTVAAVVTGQTVAETLVAKLFPGQDAASLAHLPTQELLEVAQDAFLTQHSRSDQLAPADQAPYGDESDDERGWHEARLDEDEVCDDVNGLSLNVHRRSYLGASSIHAVFRVMFHVKPSLQWELQRNIPNAAATAQGGTVTSAPWPRSFLNVTPALEEETAINAYFGHIPGIVPLIDEAYFREMWRRGQRRDRPWLALLNMVLVLGSLAVGDDESAQIYYSRAQPFLDFELLGIGCLESLQALCLLGGLYLHYKNSPNMAYAIMGLGYRIAISLGLHRQPSRLAVGNSTQGTSGGPGRPQIRRQIWWSLFCLDTWGAMTLGRPTLGRWDSKTMNVRLVVVDGSVEKTPPDPFLLSLDSARIFCLIATKIQHRFAQVLPISIDEIVALDGEVQSWHKALPPAFFHMEECPPPLVSGQYIMRNRYFNLRLLLFRPILLRYAHAGIPLESLPAPEQGAVGLCCDIACEAIDRASWPRQSLNKLLICSAVWYLYQASMVLLLRIMVDPDRSDNPKWRSAVEKALSLLSSATLWSRTAVRSKEVVERLFHVCTVAAASPSNAPDMDNLNGVPGQSIWTLLGLDMFTDEGWTWDAPEWADWGGMDYNHFGA